MLIKSVDFESLIRIGMPENTKYCVAVINCGKAIYGCIHKIIKEFSPEDVDEPLIINKMYQYNSCFYFSFKTYKEFDRMLITLKDAGFNYYYAFLYGEPVNVKR